MLMKIEKRLLKRSKAFAYLIEDIFDELDMLQMNKEEVIKDLDGWINDIREKIKSKLLQIERYHSE